MCYSTDKLCYACNSYMAQCQHPTLAAGTSNVFQARCSTKCFTRQGEDDGEYEGYEPVYLLNVKNQRARTERVRTKYCNTVIQRN
jgi:hypothetical protein